MTINQIHHLSDRELLRSTRQVADAERRSTAELLALLGEVDKRRLYLGEGCSSLFTYCVQVLHMSEHAAYHRIEGARVARKFPIVLEMVKSGELTLTNAALLGAHLTADNHRALLASVRHKTKREVEHQIASLAPRPDVTPLVRRVVATTAVADRTKPEVPAAGLTPGQPVPARTSEVRRTPATVAASASDRYLVKVTISADGHAKLRKAQDLLRHSIPNGDPAAIIERGLTLLVEHLERAKTAKTLRPRRSPRRSRRSRHIPAAVRRTVWQRDQGQCAFVGSQGRCRETGRLEFHHIVPFADGGATDVANLSLRCQAHNSYEDHLWSAQTWRAAGTETSAAPP